jgi:hypothetical protein
MSHPADADELLEVPGDELRALSEMIRGRSSGYCSLARWITVSTSASVMPSRIYQWMTKRL